MTATADPKTPIDSRSLARTPRSALDELFRRSPPGAIPRGRARGTAMLLPGSAADKLVSGLIRMLFWKGKVFNPQGGDLKNLLGPLGNRGIRATVYQDKSWFADGPAIILDYSHTSFVARKIRDEIREVSPGVYLGQVYWGKRRIALFTLEFPPQSLS
jgi:hypothetical protein